MDPVSQGRGGYSNSTVLACHLTILLCLKVSWPCCLVSPSASADRRRKIAPLMRSPRLNVLGFGPSVKLHLPAGTRITVLPGHELTSLIAILPTLRKTLAGEQRWLES